jgi:hypothetical protein
VSAMVEAVPHTPSAVTSRMKIISICALAVRRWAVYHCIAGAAAVWVAVAIVAFAVAMLVAASAMAAAAPLPPAVTASSRRRSSSRTLTAIRCDERCCLRGPQRQCQVQREKKEGLCFPFVSYQ